MVYLYGGIHLVLGEGEGLPLTQLYRQWKSVLHLSTLFMNVFLVSCRMLSTVEPCFKGIRYRAGFDKCLKGSSIFYAFVDMFKII